MVIIAEINQKDWFDYVVGTLSAFGSLATAGAFIYIFRQEKLARVQQFENNFFQLLNLHNQITTDLQKDGEIFVRAVANIRGIFIDGKDDGFGGTIPVAIDLEDFDQVRAVIKDRYENYYYKDFDYRFNHYFRNLYHVFKFVYQSKAVSWEQKKQYAAIARAQLSQKELFVIMFNAMIEDYGYPNFLFLIKKFKILDNFRDKEVEPHIVYDYFQKLQEDLETPKSFRH